MNRKSLELIALTLTLLLAPTATYGGPAEDLRTAVAPGDGPDVVLALVGVIERNPDSPLVPVALAALSRARARGLAYDEAVERLRAVVSNGVRDGENDEIMRRLLYGRLRARGETKAADALEPNRGYLLDWAVVGPFGFNARSLLDLPYEVEEKLSLEKAYAEGQGSRRFRVLSRGGDGHRVSPFDFLRPAQGVAYALAQVRSAESRPAWLKCASGASLRIWLNGEEVLRSDRLRERLPDPRFVSVMLREGWNRILVEVAGRPGTFALKLVDDDLRPIPGLVSETGLVLHETPDIDGAALRHERTRWSAPALGDSPLADAARGILAQMRGLVPEGLALLKAAARAAPSIPDLHYHLARAYRTAPHLPEVYRKNKAKLAFRRALGLEPGFASARVALAALGHADDKSEEAARDLRALLQAQPGRIDARMLLARIAADRRWEKESIDAAEACRKQDPGHGPALNFLADHHDRYGNQPEAKRLVTKALEANRASFGLISRLADYALAEGDVSAAIEHLERLIELYPGHAGSLLRLSSTLADAGREERALEILKSLARRRPRDPRYPRRIGDLYRRGGDGMKEKTAALAQYARSLALDPSQGSLRQYADLLSGAPDDFAAPYEPDVFALIREAPGREEFPRAPAICLLDHMVTQVWADGSSTDVIHMAYKLLDEKGVEAFGRVSTAGETLEVRTIDPEGRIFEPIGVQQNSYNMPALAPGAVVEYRFRMDTKRDRRWFDTGEFYFGDPEFDNAVMLSRWVVILPKDFRTELQVRNFDGRHEVTVEEDRIVHVFEKERSERIEQEPFMPGRNEILPWVRFFRNRPLSDANFLHADRLWRNLAPTPLVLAEAEKVAGELNSDIDKARDLYEHVNELVAGGFSFGGPTATILEKAGDRFELYASLLMAAGVEFELGMACPDRGEDIDWEIVDPAVFRQRCVLLEDEDGSPVWVFMGSRYFPFGRIPDRYRDSPVLVLGRSQSRIETLPPGDGARHENVTVTEIRLGSEPDQTEAEVSLTYGTDAGYGYKERLKNLDTDERRQQVEQWLANLHTGPVVTSHELPDLEKLGPPAVLGASAKLPNFLRRKGDGFEAGLGLGTLDLASTYVGKPERIHPMVLRGVTSMRDRVTIDLGGFYRVGHLPTGHATLGPLGSYSLTVKKEGSRIQVDRLVRFRPCRLTPDEYREFVQWVKAIDEAESRKIRLN